MQGFRLCGGDQRAMKTGEVCDRPLETFGAATFGVSHAQFDTISKFTCAICLRLFPVGVRSFHLA